MDTTKLMDIIKIAWPLIVIQLALQVYALYDLIKRQKTKNLNLYIWAAIIILGELLGPVAYFMLGRSES